MGQTVFLLLFSGCSQFEIIKVFVTLRMHVSGLNRFMAILGGDSKQFETVMV